MDEKKEVSRYHTYEEIPLFLDAKAIVQVLGVSRTTAYAMLSDDAFPTITVGSKKLVRKEKLFEWLQAHETDVSQAQESIYTKLSAVRGKSSPF